MSGLNNTLSRGGHGEARENCREHLFHMERENNIGPRQIFQSWLIEESRSAQIIAQGCIGLVTHFNLCPHTRRHSGGPSNDRFNMNGKIIINSIWSSLSAPCSRSQHYQARNPMCFIMPNEIKKCSLHSFKL